MPLNTVSQHLKIKDSKHKYNEYLGTATRHYEE